MTMNAQSGKRVVLSFAVLGFINTTFLIYSTEHVQRFSSEIIKEAPNWIPQFYAEPTLSPEEIARQQELLRLELLRQREERFAEVLDYNVTQLTQLVANHSDTQKNCSFNWYQKNQTHEICTFSTLESYMDECGYFPGNFTWLPNYELTMSFCKLTGFRNMEIRKYFHRSIKKVVAIGDSQAYRYSGAFYGQLNQAGINCKLIKKEPEGFKVSTAYFRRKNTPEHADALVTPTRTCQSCTSFLHSCTVPPVPLSGFNHSKTFLFEYISLVMSNNASMLNMNYCAKHPNISICQHRSQPDFIFKYYLNGSYPDLLLMFTTFGHDVRMPLRTNSENLRTLHNLIHSTLPNTSDVVWLTTTAPNWRRNFPPPKIKDFVPEQGLNRKTKTEILNHWLYEIMTNFPARDVGAKFHGFVDLWTLGLAREKEWAHDIIHFNQPFYRTVMSILLRLLPSLNG